MLTAEAAANSNGGGATLVGQNCFTICERHRLLKEIGAKEDNEASKALHQGRVTCPMAFAFFVCWFG